MTRTVGFVGLGNMGLPISLRRVKAGHRVIGCDARQEMRAQFTVAGGEWAEGATEE